MTPNQAEKEKPTAPPVSNSNDFIISENKANDKSDYPQIKEAPFSFKEAIASEVEETAKVVSLKAQGSGLFAIKSANDWINEAKQRPLPEQLFKELWHTGEISILFADSNVGKSILAVQIGEELSKKFPVLYFDFELSDKQFEQRYSIEFTNHYLFSNNFLRAEINPDCDFEGHESFEDYLIFSIENVITQTGIKVLIIDNITYLKNETEKAKYALPLMKKLKELKKKHSLSILVLAHTPKRDLTKPITQNDLQGSKAIMNFCDSSFAIGASHKDKNIRYVKQIKERNTPKIYDAENVIVYQISKPDNFLFMEFIGYGCEREHLRIISEKDREDIIDRTKQLHTKGLSQRLIAKELGISVGAVNNYINKTT